MTGLDTAASRCLSRSLLVSGLGCVRGGRVLLRDLDLELAAGQLLMLRGHNGAGKSSLLRCLAGLLPWRAGSLQWCGGTLAPGSPADVCVIDPGREWTIDKNAFASKGRNTPYHGMAVKGGVWLTMVGGKPVFDNTLPN